MLNDTISISKMIYQKKYNIIFDRKGGNMSVSITTIRIDSDILKKAKIESINQSISLSKLIENLIIANSKEKALVHNLGGLTSAKQSPQP